MPKFWITSSEIVQLEFVCEAESEDDAVTKCLESGPGEEVNRHSWQIDNVTKEENHAST